MKFNGLRVPEVTNKQWQQFADVKAALGLRHNSPPAIARLTDVIMQYTNIPHTIATALSKVLTKHPIDKIGLSEGEKDFVLEFFTDNRNGISLVLGAGDILDNILPKQITQKKEKDDGKGNKDSGAGSEGKPKKRRKTRSDKGRKRNKAKSLEGAGSV